ncbi:MAG: phage holin family protein [Solibacillus sp.]
MKTNTLYTSLVGGSMAWVAYFVGGVDHLIKAFVIFMAIDYMLGIMVGFAFKNVESKKAFKGLVKKGCDDINGYCSGTIRFSNRKWEFHA